eukprot:TRINITY_DN12716_c0_g1_i1.p1 TRINITY_DN12716_c0_g1~~TRINITY_DN12716_c0_g1_i1.p1  ORF type:complete len:440 (-),score=39.63 TRINITY_DN12716_c0_g1_i1:224-1477(-)
MTSIDSLLYSRRINCRTTLSVKVRRHHTLLRRLHVLAAAAVSLLVSSRNHSTIDAAVLPPYVDRSRPQRRHSKHVATTPVAKNKKVLEVEPFAFPTELSDHMETPTSAFKHIANMLREVGKIQYPDLVWKKSSEKLTIYDPYYCMGGIKKKLGRLGFPNVYNTNEDFYKVANTSDEPDFDILVTNPPYVDIERHCNFTFEYASSRGKPSFILLPFHMLFSTVFEEWINKLSPSGLEPFYLTPPKTNKYMFKTPSPLPPSVEKVKKQNSVKRARTMQVHTVWVGQGGTDIEVHKRLREAAQAGQHQGCYFADSLKNIVPQVFPSQFKQGMADVAKRQGVEIPETVKIRNDPNANDDEEDSEEDSLDEKPRDTGPIKDEMRHFVDGFKKYSKRRWQAKKHGRLDEKFRKPNIPTSGNWM